MSRSAWSRCALAILLAVAAAPLRAEHALILKDNMAVLRCAPPSADLRYAGSNAPQQIFFADESVDVQLAFAKAAEKPGDWAIEIQEVTTRDPDKKIEDMEGYTDTGGHAPLIGLEGKPVVHPIKAVFDGKAQTIANVPVPHRFGTYALVLVNGPSRTFLATVARVPRPRAGGTLENTPIFGEFSMFDKPELFEQRASAYERMGIHGMRLETSWSEDKDGKADWTGTDRIFDAIGRHGVQLMVTLGGMRSWAWPFAPDQTPAAVGPTWDFNPYSGQADWVADPKLYPRYGKWITAFAQRYWKNGQGGLWGFENYNEPWEGGGISGWARDMLEYRKIQKLIAESAHAVDPRIKICAASSIMNTEDKLFPDGSNEFDKYIDVFTDHYVTPSMCYGPLVAKAHGKVSVETETWFVNTEYLLPQGVAQFMASGQGRLSPWHPRVLFDQLPGNEDHYFIPTPVVAATAAFNSMVTGKAFERVVFMNHLPWVFQFGKDDDTDALLILFGQLVTIGGDSPRERLWAQVEGSSGGTMTIDNADGLLRFCDLAGNPAQVGEAKVTLPMNIFPSYIKCEKGPKAATERLAAARIEGKRPVEILPHDFSKRVDEAGCAIEVAVHNCLSRPIAGKLAVRPPDGIVLASPQSDCPLAAGETRMIKFALTSGKANSANAYPFAFHFTSDGGDADYREVMNVAIVPHRTIKVDGNLDDWNDIPGITIAATLQKAEMEEMLRRPWLDLRDQKPNGNFGEFKLAWDEKYLYVCARVNDPTPQIDLPPIAGRDEDSYFHSRADDSIEPFKTFLQKHPGHSFAEVPYVYSKPPEASIHFRRDRLHIGLDVTPDWHDLTPDTDRVPYGFHAVPDTDYEYALYPCSGGRSECWRLLAPGVPRINDWPHQPHGARTTGPVPGAVHVVRREGDVYYYEMAIPREELKDLKLTVGTTFGLALRAGNGGKGPNVDYGADKAVTKSNGLTLHPYWEHKPSCGVKWTLVE